MATASTETNTFKFELVTPDQVLLTLDADKLVAKSKTGEFGVLPKHADMVCELDTAPLRYWYRGQEEFVAVMGGVLEVTDNKVTVITDYAKRGEDIDEARANQEAERAKTELNMLKSKDTNHRDLLIAEYRLQREMILLQTSKLRRNK